MIRWYLADHYAHGFDRCVQRAAHGLCHLADALLDACVIAAFDEGDLDDRHEVAFLYSRSPPRVSGSRVNTISAASAKKPAVAPSAALTLLPCEIRPTSAGASALKARPVL